MPSGYYDLYAEAGSIFIIKLNFLDANGVSANLAYRANNSYYIPEELKAIGWTEVTSITAKLQVKKKPTADGTTDTSLIEFKTDTGATNPIEFINTRLDPSSGNPINDHNILIYTTNPNFAVGTHFYDLEMTFNGKKSGTAQTAIVLRILQGRFTLTPQVTG
jgi:hypothetical protein